jgi:predicted  nucleic acid-binding Zn-ribbon protein
MTARITIDCEGCDSKFTLEFKDDNVSQEYPEYCPFCGEIIEELSEDYIEDDDDSLDEERWD